MRGRMPGNSGQALQRDGQVRAGNFDLILLEQIQTVRLVLHHDATLLHVLGVVVGRAGLVRVSM